MFKKSAIALLICFAFFIALVSPGAFATDGTVINVDGLYDSEIGEIIDGNDDNPTDGKEDTAPDQTPAEDEKNNQNSGNASSGSHGGFVNNGGHSGGTTTVLPTNSAQTTPDESAKDDTTTAPDTAAPDTNDGEKVTFSDVTDADWFCSDVTTLAGMGVINGYNDGTFKPDDNVTRAEFLKLLVSLIYGDNLFVTYDALFDDVPPTEWYSTYIATSAVYGIIDLKEYGTTFEPDRPITRREVAKFITSALSVEADEFATPYADTADHNVICLYGLGLMQGNFDPTTGARFFYPDTEITRAETSAVILRVFKLMTLGDSYVADFFAQNKLPPLQSLYVPLTEESFNNDIANAWGNSQAFLVYKSRDNAGSENMARAVETASVCYTELAVAHPEISAFIAMKADVSATEDGSRLLLTFYSECEKFGYAELCENAKKAEALAEKIASSQGFAQLSDGERADAICEYLTESIVYDSEYLPESYTAYGALSNGKAVCQGYAGAFNLLCRASGVSSYAVADGDHMWNEALQNGEIRVYDCSI